MSRWSPRSSYGIATAGKVLTVPIGSACCCRTTFVAGAGMARARRGARLHRRGGAASGRWRLDRGAARRDRSTGRAAGWDGVDLVGALGRRRHCRSRTRRRRAQGARCALRHRCDARRGGDAHRCAGAGSRLPGVPDLQVGAGTLWTRGPLRCPALAGRRADRAGRLATARHQLRTRALYSRRVVS